MEEQGDMSQVMGFSDFGGKKKARQFDFMAMFEETRKNAIERSEQTLASRQEDDEKLRAKFESSLTSRPSGSSSKLESRSPPKESSKFKPAFKSSFKPTFRSKISEEKDSDSGSDRETDLSTGKDSAEASSSKATLHNSSESEEDLIGPPLPPSMVESTTSSTRQEESHEEGSVGPPLPPDMQPVKDSEDDDEEEDDLEEDNNPVKKIPSSHEISLDHGAKTVSALALDPSGARLVTGGYDYEVKFWDFAGMNASLQSFRTITPCERHQIKALEYSITGEHILVVAGNSKAKVLDRDGFEVMECVKGDQYLVDMASTKGHAGMLNSGCWHPKVKEEFMTCSIDGTVRLWDVTQGGKKHRACIKPRSQQGRKVVPTTCVYSRDGNWVAAACQDGSIHVWDHRKNFVNVALQNKTAHMNGSDTSCLSFSYDGLTLASRGGDDTLKLWDMRKFKSPLCTADDLYNLYPITDCVFSPDDQLVLTGLSVRKGEGTGKLVFFDRQSLNRVYEMDIVNGGSVVRCLWHPKLNQIVVGCSDGYAKMYYDPDKSQRGAKLCVVKTKSKVKQSEIMIATNIFTPHALKMFRQSRPTTTKRQEEKDRKDPLRSHRPDLPVSGPGHGGRLGNKGATLSQYVVQTLVKRKPDERDKDPRAAILRHAEEAAKNPYWVDPAYKQNQPEPVFQASTTSDDEKEDTDIEPVWKKPKV